MSEFHHDSTPDDSQPGYEGGTGFDTDSAEESYEEGALSREAEELMEDIMTRPAYPPIEIPADLTEDDAAYRPLFDRDPGEDPYAQ